MADPTELTNLSQAQVNAVKAVHGDENVDVIAQDGGLFTVQIRFADPPPASADPGWAAAPRVGTQGPHSKFGGQSWRYDETGVFIGGNTTPERSGGSPVTCSTIVSLYAKQILKAAQAHGVPPELIVMTIATETAIYRDSNYTGPPTFRWEAHVKVRDVDPPTVGDYSAGPMQTLATTAREVFRRNRPGEDPFRFAPAFAVRPAPSPDQNPLYDPDVNIDFGAAEIAHRLAATGFDPILVAACYNHGSLAASGDNPWGLFTHGDHLNRASEWFGDACAVIGRLRLGQPIDPNSVKSPKLALSTQTAGGGQSFEIGQLTREAADEEMKFYRDSDAVVHVIDNGGGLFTLQVAFPPPGGVVAPPPGVDTPTPDRDGYVVVVNRNRTERRNSTGAMRTVGFYQAYFDRQRIPDIAGIAVERPGPGDNSLNGRARAARIEPGVYPLFTHSSGLGPGGRVKYRTFGFSDVVNVAARPWPANPGGKHPQPRRHPDPLRRRFPDEYRLYQPVGGARFGQCQYRLRGQPPARHRAHRQHAEQARRLSVRQRSEDRQRLPAGDRRSGLTRRRRKTTRAAIDEACDRIVGPQRRVARVSAATRDGDFDIIPSRRSRSRSKLASTGPSRTRPRGSLMRIGSTKRPLTRIS